MLVTFTVAENFSLILFFFKLFSLVLFLVLTASFLAKKQQLESEIVLIKELCTKQK